MTNKPKASLFIHPVIGVPLFSIYVGIISVLLVAFRPAMSYPLLGVCVAVIWASGVCSAIVTYIYVKYNGINVVSGLIGLLPRDGIPMAAAAFAFVFYGEAALEFVFLILCLFLATLPLNIVLVLQRAEAKIE